MAIFIDGYNLLHVTGLVGRGIGPGTLQRCRNALLNCIATSLATEELANTTIVFDAQNPPPNHPHEYQRQGMWVKYAVGYADADAMLEELIRRDSAPRRLTVVSSDHRVQRAARRRRATAIDSDVWFDALGKKDARPKPTSARDATKPVGKLSELEVETWLEAFRDDSADDTQLDIVDNLDSAEAKPTDLANPFPPGYADDLLEEEE